MCRNAASMQDNGNWKVYLGLIGVFLLLVLVFFLYKAKIRKELRENMRVQVSDTVSRYFELNDAVELKESEKPVVKASYY